MKVAGAIVFFSAAMAVAGSSFAGDTQNAAAKPPPCSAPAYRQFDFWAGAWSVTDPDGKPAGTNRIEVILGGCALQEHWRGAEGGTGTSLNVYDARRHVWHQTWVDSGGGLLVLEGGTHDGSMVLSGTSTSRTGKQVLNRITWTPKDADHVRQLWEVSLDDGRHWKTVFDGLYTRTPAEN
jgi:hypothetical protein